MWTGSEPALSEVERTQSASAARAGSVSAPTKHMPAIGIGGRVAPPPLPHHRTCGSAYGGSADEAKTARSRVEARAWQSRHWAKQWPRRASWRCATDRED